MNYYSVRIDEGVVSREQLLEYAKYSKFNEVIFCRETYSIKNKRECKPHFHIAIATTLSKSSVRARLVAIDKQLISKKEETKKYSTTEFGKDEKDIRNWRQYHTKGNSIEEYDVIYSTYSKEELDTFHRSFWKDREEFIETRKEKKKGWKELLGYLEEKRGYFLYDREDIEGGKFDNYEMSWTPLRRHNCKILHREKLLELIIHFFEGNTNTFRVETIFNRALYYFHKDTLVSDIIGRIGQYRSLTPIIISTESIEANGLSQEDISQETSSISSEEETY